MRHHYWANKTCIFFVVTYHLTLCVNFPSAGSPVSKLGSNLTCDSVMSGIGWIIAVCVLVPLIVVILLIVIVCFYRLRKDVDNAKSMQIYIDESVPARSMEYYPSQKKDTASMQVYSEPNFYTEAPTQIQPSTLERQPIYPCPHNCPCIGRSPAHRQLLPIPSPGTIPLYNNTSPSISSAGSPHPQRPHAVYSHLQVKYIWFTEVNRRGSVSYF